MLRSEPPVTHVFGHGWSLSMVIGVLLAIAGVIMWFGFGVLNPKNTSKGVGITPEPA